MANGHGSIDAAGPIAGSSPGTAEQSLVKAPVGGWKLEERGTSRPPPIDPCDRSQTILQAYTKGVPYTIQKRDKRRKPSTKQEIELGRRFFSQGASSQGDWASAKVADPLGLRNFCISLQRKGGGQKS